MPQNKKNKKSQALSKKEKKEVVKLIDKRARLWRYWQTSYNITHGTNWSAFAFPIEWMPSVGDLGFPTTDNQAMAKTSAKIDVKFLNMEIMTFCPNFSFIRVSGGNIEQTDVNYGFYRIVVVRFKERPLNPTITAPYQIASTAQYIRDDDNMGSASEDGIFDPRQCTIVYDKLQVLSTNNAYSHLKIKIPIKNTMICEWDYNKELIKGNYGVFFFFPSDTEYDLPGTFSRVNMRIGYYSDF